MKIFNKKTSREEESRKAREVNLELGNTQSLFHSAVRKNTFFARMHKSASLYSAVRKLISEYREIFNKDFYKIATYEERKKKEN